MNTFNYDNKDRNYYDYDNSNPISGNQYEDYQLPPPLQLQERQQPQRQQNAIQYHLTPQQDQPRGISQAQPVRPKSLQDIPSNNQANQPTQNIGVIQRYGQNQH